MSHASRRIALPGAPAPIEALRRLRGLPHRVLLETAGGEDEPTAGDARSAAPSGRTRSWLTADPLAVLVARNGRSTTRGHLPGIAALEGLDPFTALERLLQIAAPPASSEPVISGHGLAVAGDRSPFGGCFGYLGFEAGDVLERLPPPAEEEASDLPDAWFGVFPWVIAWDDGCELRGRLLPGMDPDRFERELTRVRDAVLGPAGGHGCGDEVPGLSPRDPDRGSGSRASQRGGVAAPRESFPLEARSDATSSMGRDGFIAGVERIQEYIRAGDLFQANLTHRVRRPVSLDGESLLVRLRRQSPAPYTAYLDTGTGEVISISPESFLSLEGRRVETRPIKGTARRGGTPGEDRRLSAQLEASEKDRAENVMIVDLLRNDLSRVCTAGSVEVPELLRLERHPTVHHLVSTVTGTLRPDRGIVDLLRATFPGGSISGAPRIRAIEILRELEPVRRGVYTGALGMLTFEGDASLSIAIRTAVLRDGIASYGTGGGITLASEPEAEWEETLDKAAAFLKATDP